MSPSMFRFILPALLAAGFSALAPSQGAKAPPPAELRPGFDSIAERDARPILEFLAGPECEGRETGTAGYEKAAAYVAERFQEYGLKAAGADGSYFQMVPFTRRRASPQESFLEFKDLRLACGEDVAFRAFDGEIEHEAVFVQAGTDAKLPDSKPLRNAIVILNTDADYLSPIMGQLRRERPRAIIKVFDKVAEPGWSVDPPRRELWGGISRDAAKRLAKSGGVSERLLDPRSPKDAARLSATRGKARIVAKTESERVGVPNVAGMIEGSDPVLKREYVICGAHLDHLGIREDGAIYYGADDDGSGTTGLLLLARALALNPQKPKRSVMFLAFCGEEKGLLGSKHYCDNPLVPHGDVICELQMDMIGRNEEKAGGGREPAEKASDNVRTMHLVGSKRLSMELHEKILDANRHIGFDFEYDEEAVYTRSDHYNFAKVGIPVAFFFSGFHPDYHKVTDTPEKINYAKLADTARLVYLTVHSVGSQVERIRLDGTDRR